eukprot:1283382-Amphidinium_carterae.1
MLISEFMLCHEGRSDGGYLTAYPTGYSCFLVAPLYDGLGETRRHLVVAHKLAISPLIALAAVLLLFGKLPDEMHDVLPVLREIQKIRSACRTAVQ